MKKILVVEDDDLLSKLIKFKLSKEGFDVYVSNDGNCGIKCINEVSPDLVLTDLMMPFKSGFEILNHISKNNLNIPVIVISALGENEKSVLDCFGLGAKDFISKPFNPNELVIRIKRFI